MGSGLGRFCQPDATRNDPLSACFLLQYLRRGSRPFRVVHESRTWGAIAPVSMRCAHGDVLALSCRAVWTSSRQSHPSVLILEPGRWRVFSLDRLLPIRGCQASRRSPCLCDRHAYPAKVLMGANVCLCASLRIYSVRFWCPLPASQRTPPFVSFHSLSVDRFS